MRQLQRHFVGNLYNARIGVLQPFTHRYWESRSFVRLPPEQQMHFYSLNNNTCLYATCTNRKKDEINTKYISAASDVCLLKATLTGSAHQNNNNTSHGASFLGQMKGILRFIYIKPGMMVKVLANLLSNFGVSNGSRGTLMDIIWKSGLGYNQDEEYIAIVDLPDYTGPAISPEMERRGLKTWVAIPFSTLYCGKQCCSRTGLPLTVSKADTVHSLQGTTIGAGKTITHLHVKL